MQTQILQQSNKRAKLSTDLDFHKMQHYANSTFKQGVEVNTQQRVASTKNTAKRYVMFYYAMHWSLRTSVEGCG